MRPYGAMVLVAQLLIPSGAGAQHPVEPGDRVRVQLVGERTRVVGRVEDVGRDSLSLSVDHVRGRRRGRCPDRLVGRCSAGRTGDDGASVTLGLDEVSGVERSVGTHRNTGRFALGAGLVGGTIGALTFSTCTGCYTEWWSLGAAVFGIPSLFLGGILGWFVISEDWRVVSGAWSERVGAVLPAAALPAADGGVMLVWSMGAP